MLFDCIKCLNVKNFNNRIISMLIDLFVYNVKEFIECSESNSHGKDRLCLVN